MKKVSGLFVGLNTLDVQFIVDRYPGANEKAKAENFDIHTGGPATNACITFSHLGGKANLLTSLGIDPLHQISLQEFNKFGIDVTDFTPERMDHPVFASVITSKYSGERSITSYHPQHNDIKPEILDNVNTDIYEIVLVDGFYMDAAIKIAKKTKGKVPVVLDGGSWKKNMEKLLPLIDIAICSADFRPPGTNIENDVFKFLKGYNINKIAVTRGEKSILMMENESFNKINIPHVTIKDSLGAGDVFHGAFCYYYASNPDFYQALAGAALVASESCKHYGTRSWMN